ncbi:MAG: AbiH family protein [Imperialibacter sp.]|uniref:AbiH family protein n=1 Tax=Imperialibacter sp. TaxID=2038411 RepID=UPI0032EA93BA
MNRLIIVGNGFDLAHGLPTSYDNFVDYYFTSVAQNLGTRYSHEDDLLRASTTIGNFKTFNINSFEKFKEAKEQKLLRAEFNNSFFETMVFQKSENWVGIEELYYNTLTSIVQDQIRARTFLDMSTRREFSRKARELNEKFDQVKTHFHNYLVSEVKERYEFRTLQEFIGPFYSDYHTFNPLTLKLANIYPLERICILNFNYTKLANLYLTKGLQSKGSLCINIHGELESQINPIVFGYGDERDHAFYLLEDLGIDDLLVNIKSIWYHKSYNYWQISEFLKSKPFEIVILGHSCGMSDRTLLSWIFEHKNCVRLRPYYYGGIDGFDKLTINISRNFENKETQRKVFQFDQALVFPSGQLNFQNRTK